MFIHLTTDTKRYTCNTQDKIICQWNCPQTSCAIGWIASKIFYATDIYIQISAVNFRYSVMSIYLIILLD